MAKKNFQEIIKSDIDKKKNQNLSIDNNKLKETIDKQKDTIEQLRHSLAHANNEANTSEIEFKNIKIIRNLRDKFEYEDIQELSENILSIGQLQSVLLTSDNHLISGHRRYYAIELLIKSDKHNGLVKCIKIDKTYKEIGLELFDKLQFMENEQRKDIDNFQRASIFSEYKNKGYSQEQISELFEKDKAVVSRIITINNIDDNLKRLLKEIQYFGITKKKFHAVNKSLHDRDSNYLGINTLYKIAIEKGLKAQSKVFLAYFSTKLSDSELLDFGVKHIENKEPVRVSVFKKINENFSLKLDTLIKKFPEKIEKIEQAKKDISKIIKSLEK